MGKFKFTPETRDLLGHNLANHMTRINADCNMISTALHDFYIDGAEKVLLCADIPYKFNKSDDRKRYISLELDGVTYPVPEEEAAP